MKLDALEPLLFLLDSCDNLSEDDVSWRIATIHELNDREVPKDVQIPHVK